MPKPFTIDHARGMLAGLAVGDAVGTTVEFSPKGSFAQVTDMVGGGPFRLKAGQWTDDTSMALCLADSLLACDGWNAADCMDRFQRWRMDGENSSTGTCFDIGMQTRDALTAYAVSANPYAGPVEHDRSGNAGVMRLAPAAIAYGVDTQRACRAADLQSRTTHGSVACLEAARLMAAFLVTGDRQLVPAPQDPPDRATGYVVHSMQAAYWALATTDNFRDAVLRVVNEGEDADTTGAIVGQLAGRLYGYSAIPEAWLERLHARAHILALADALYALEPGELS